MEIKSGSKIHLPLWEHQKAGVERAVYADGFGFFFEVGTGKSRTVINTIRHIYASNKRLMRTLILSPKITLTNWNRELVEYSKIHPLDIHVLKGSGKKRVDTFSKHAHTAEGFLTRDHVFITNYEALQMSSLYDLLLKWQPEIIICDEAHRIKNPKSKRAKALFPLSDRAERRYALTGTPILNTPMDIFNIFKFIDKGEMFGRNFFAFRSQWFEDENASFAGKPNYFPKYVPRPETYEVFNKMIKLRSMRALKSECLDLPPFIREELHIELSAEQNRLYKEMEKEFITFIKDRENNGELRAVTAQIALTKSLRLQQICAGFVKDEQGAIHKLEENPRLDALQELLEDYAEHHKIIVWSVFQETYKDIAALLTKLGIAHVELHGKTPQGDRDKNIDAFNNDPKIRVMIANQGAGGIGINLIASDMSIYYTKGPFAEQDVQSEARNYRGGSEIHQKVTRIDLVAPNTTDELINTALKEKKNVAEMLLDWRGNDFKGKA
jgi:SNF2 family DNA or RNA helicase